MATLVLTAVGTAIGGPLGGAIGAMLGQRADRALLGGGKAREGARLSDLKVQTSSYGSDIPLLFGATRVAGSVIWSTDLIETRSTSSAGKGQPSVNSYNYAASFAVVLSARPIRAVRRIWADGNLLRGAGGDWKAQTGFRLYPGGEDQVVDPLIASDVGIALAPAHRGCAYAVFEMLQLADFGNRIPSLTFEVIADDGAVSAGDIAAAVAGEVRGTAGWAVDGFAAGDASVRDTLDGLGQAAGAWFAGAGGGLAMRDDARPDAVLTDAGARAGGDAARCTRQVAAIETVPRAITLSCYDPARDYQAGVQRARRPGAGNRETSVALPAVIGAAAAKTAATAMLARAEAARTVRTVACGVEALGLAPGQCVAIAGEDGAWRVTDVLVEAMVVRVTLTPVAAATVAVRGADAGRVLASPDAPAGQTRLAVFETLPLDDSVLTQPRLSVAACGTGAGWRRAALLVSMDDGASWTAAGATALPAVMGVVAAADDDMLEVVLMRDDVALEEADAGRLDAGANLALVGDELVQFAHAAPLDDQPDAARWRLTGLRPGRRGTEVGVHGAGDRFVLLGQDTVRGIDLPLAVLGREVRVMATGVGDTAGPAAARMVVAGASVLPPAPEGAAWSRDAAGDVAISWTRRSRLSGRSAADAAPLVEEREAYRVTATLNGGRVVEAEVAASAWMLAAADAAGGTTVSIRQRGTYGESPPAMVMVAAAG